MKKDRGKNTCCFVGHRIIHADKLADMTHALQKEILQAVADGYTHFISGFDEGAGLTAANIVADLKKHNTDLKLEAALPYRGRIKTADQSFHRLLALCDIVGVYHEDYDPFCFIRRSRRMVFLAGRLIAVYDGSNDSEVCSALRYAHTQGLDIRIISL